MNKKILASIISIGLIFASLVVFYTPVWNYLEKQAQAKAFSCLGSVKAPEEISKRINDLALKIGFDRPVDVYKFSINGLRVYGYHNAIALNPTYFMFIFNKPTIYISTGFFEDLDIDEQDFILTHELYHLKENHLVKIFILGIILDLIIFILVFLIAYFLIFRRFGRSKKGFAWALTAFLFLVMGLVGQGLELWHRRFIEREADIKAISYLGTDSGLKKFLERCLKDFKVPDENRYYGIMSDHPGCSERKEYCDVILKNMKGNHEN